ncbi:TPA: hypothetical protein DD449_04400 [Candidatus Berkelbacteria bacterium]|uniref:Uncharacterized protein n=1 Tax=Berkelbacteria bacterium GW2011_GWE1_39_12 TaxID=1618337 RepID=A0A0G4B417_9BACT|nr:MAG: hypothetical protein UT28_C0001G0500 [Berkelbacteria bacterium GW2011_GWE1_39_12]HBO60896.1 hypothetical protein [Candidatus Berkelbacteria bacterium]
MRSFLITLKRIVKVVLYFPIVWLICPEWVGSFVTVFTVAMFLEHHSAVWAIASIILIGTTIFHLASLKLGKEGDWLAKGYASFLDRLIPDDIICIP